MSVLDKINMQALPENQYVREKTNKKQIYLHHTAGSANPFGVVEYWARTPQRIATSFIIAGKQTTNNSPWKDGEIIQTYSTNYWGYHLGVKQSAAYLESPALDKMSIGIEICNYGPLTKRSDGKFINDYKGVMKDEEVFDLGRSYRGFRYWHAYTSAQIESTKELLVFLCDKWSIPIKYKGDEIFNLNSRALSGESGIWSHTSVRSDKTDIYPHPELISMLKSL